VTSNGASSCRPTALGDLARDWQRNLAAPA
jgi:hypothetical protein